MASIQTENAVISDLQAYKELFPIAYPNRPKSELKKNIALVEDGIISVEMLLEKAIEVCGGIARYHTDGMDFEDWSDAKKATTQALVEKRKTPRRRATIQNLKTKVGTLRILVTETMTGLNYYFVIPHEAYSHLKKINIYFGEHGQPLNGKWFKFRVKTFDELSARCYRHIKKAA